MSSQICRSASRAARSLLSASKNSRFYSEGGRAAAAATAVTFSGKSSFLLSNAAKAGSANASSAWISGALALPAAVYMLQDQEANAAEFERAFIAIKLKRGDVQRGLISEIIARFERKGFKLVAGQIFIPSFHYLLWKGENCVWIFARKHYHDLKERRFFNGLCDFLGSGLDIGMVWEGEGVIKYGRNFISTPDPQKSEPGTIRGDLAVVVARNIIHGSDGPETAKDKIDLWSQPVEVVAYTSNAEKWFYRPIKDRDTNKLIYSD